VQDFEIDAAFQLGDFSSLRLQPYVQLLERVLMQRFNRVSTISDRMVERLSAKGVDRARGMLFSNWVDTSVIYPLPTPSPLRQEFGIAEQAVVALYSGSIGKKQGLNLLMEASRRLASRRNIQFVICADGPDREQFARIARQAGNVMLLPLQPADRLNELLNLADVHLLPQLAAAADLVMPSKLTGMMASGGAIVATAHAGTQLATVLEGRGVVTPPGDVDAFVAAVIRLAEDSALRQRLGQEARKYAVDHMNRDEILSRFELSMMIARGHSPLATPTKLEDITSSS
jgi:colanic acid biosynthesis glycosyl transferase WcaI